MTVAAARARRARASRARATALRARRPCRSTAAWSCARCARPPRRSSVKPSKGKSVSWSRSIRPGSSRARSRAPKLPLRYKLKVDYGEGGKFTLEDPYAFAPTLGELDLHLIGEGRHEELYDKLGAHVAQASRASTGTAFAVWAPAARAVSVVGDFNSWDGRLHAMRSLGSTGIWELFLPDVGEGARYKYEILTADGELTLKADPFAQETEVPPRTASVVIALAPQVEQGGRRLSSSTAASAAARAADLDLRGPRRLVAAEHARGQPLAHLPRARRRAVGLRHRHGLHARRAAAGDGASVHRLVGLPGDRLLRPHPALRLAR